MRPRLAATLVLALLAAVAFWFVTRPVGLDGADVATAPSGDAVRGEMVFWQGGCASCHAAPGAAGEERLKLGGGLKLASPFGDFHAPNISSDERDGIGAWDFAAFANALQRGVSPEGEHYYPAFPYTSYARMTLSDVADLFAFMKTLPAVAGRAPDHELPFPFSIRRLLGGWKFLFFAPRPVLALADTGDEVRRGQYLVEGPGHCGECHTPRNLLGGARYGEWLAGAPNPDGKGIIPNITGGERGLSDWSAGQIASFLKDGFTPEFDSAGGSMTQVIANWARVTDEDRAAVAAYLKAVPPRPAGYPLKK